MGISSMRRRTAPQGTPSRSSWKVALLVHQQRHPRGSAGWPRQPRLAAAAANLRALDLPRRAGSRTNAPRTCAPPLLRSPASALKPGTSLASLAGRGTDLLSRVGPCPIHSVTLHQSASTANQRTEIRTAKIRTAKCP